MHILLMTIRLYCVGGGGGVPVRRMLAGMDLSKPEKNRSKPDMNLVVNMFFLLLW